MITISILRSNKDVRNGWRRDRNTVHGSSWNSGIGLPRTGDRERIDEKIFDKDKRQVVSPGQAVVAMILNGLGFTNRRLYLTSQFFEGKPVERLLGANIQASDLTDYTLGHTLDEISRYGASQLFAETAFAIAIENNLFGNLNHLDTTRISVEGEYDIEDKLSKIEITHGYSKDHRPDLKQMVLSLVVNGPSEIPIMDGSLKWK